MKVKSESEVAQSYPTLSDPMDCSLPGSSAHGIFQARVLEWAAIAFSVSGIRPTLILYDLNLITYAKTLFLSKVTFIAIRDYDLNIFFWMTQLNPKH